MSWPRFWTPERLERLRELWADERLTPADIAEQIGTTDDSVRYAVSAYKLPKRGSYAVVRRRRAAKAALPKRPCIRCRTPFPSHGPHHRMCDACRRYAESIRGGLDVMYL